MIQKGYMARNPAGTLNQETVPKVAQEVQSKVNANLGVIKCGIDAEFDKALRIYCNSESNLSDIYWPRNFRALCTYVLEYLLLKPEIWSELNAQIVVNAKIENDTPNKIITPSFGINRSNIQGLIYAVNASFIEEVSRRWIVCILREISRSRRRFGLDARLPNYHREKEGWPSDLESKVDLSSSLTDISLRDDVSDFIIKLFDEEIPNERYCAMDYVGATQKPLIIEVTEDYYEKFSKRIKTESDSLRVQFGYTNYLPEDLIEIKAVPVRGPMTPNEEGFHNCGSS